MKVMILCGGYGTDGGKLIRYGETTTVSDEEGLRLINLGVAKMVDSAEGPAEERSQRVEEDSQESEDNLDGMKRADLFRLAKSLGIKVSGTMTKETLKQKIREAEEDEEAEEEEEPGADEDPAFAPELRAEDDIIV